MLANVSKQNYDEYHTTYDTLSKIFGESDDIDAYLVGGIFSTKVFIFFFVYVIVIS